jgi:hypothetical protein
VWVEPARLAEPRVLVRCSGCGRQATLEGGHAGGAATDRLAEEARQLAREAQIDLPSAYAVLLGAMSFEEVLQRDDTGADAGAAASPGRGSTRLGGYDPAFQPAIDAGHLSPLQAMQRGKRQIYAALVARRHGLAEEAALAVADNSLALADALRQRVGPTGIPILTVEAPARARSTARLWIPAVLVGVVIVLAAIVTLRHAFQVTVPTAPGARLRSVLGAEVRTDEWGRVVEVGAADPKSVLAAYCASDRDRRFEPVDVVPLVDGGEVGRLALLRRSGRSAEMLSIVVREDRGRSLWVAGDGNAPLVPRTAPRAAAEAFRGKGAPAN